MLIFLYVIAGGLAGFLAGLVGIGGGVVVVPALVTIFMRSGLIPSEILMQTAAGTSLAIMLFTAQASVRAHAKLGRIRKDIFFSLLPGVILGVVSGVFLADHLPSILLMRIFGGFLFFIAWKMFWRRSNEGAIYQSPRAWIHNFMSWLIGLKSGLLGIGGGAIIIPYLHFCGLSFLYIAPVTALISLSVATVGTFMAIITGLNEVNLPAWSTGYVYWPAVPAMAIPSMLCAPLGARAAHRLPEKWVKLAFVGLLCITATKLLIGSL